MTFLIALVNNSYKLPHLRVELYVISKKYLESFQNLFGFSDTDKNTMNLTFY